MNVRFARLVAGSSFDTHKGTIALSVPTGAGFDLVADVGRRGRLEGPPIVASVQRDEDHVYRGKVNGGGPRLDLSTHKGTIRIDRR